MVQLHAAGGLQGCSVYLRGARTAANTLASPLATTSGIFYFRYVPKQDQVDQGAGKVLPDLCYRLIQVFLIVIGSEIREIPRAAVGYEYSCMIVLGICIGLLVTH